MHLPRDSITNERGIFFVKDPDDVLGLLKMLDYLKIILCGDDVSGCLYLFALHKKENLRADAIDEKEIKNDFVISVFLLKALLLC